MIGVNGIWYTFNDDDLGELVDYQIYDVDKVVIEGTGTMGQMTDLYEEYLKKIAKVEQWSGERKKPFDEYFQALDKGTLH